MPPLREPDQRSGVRKHPDDSQAQRQATGSPKCREIQGRSADGEVKTFIASCWFWRSSLPQQPYTKTPFYKGQMAATCILRKLFSYWITQCFIYVMCHCCRKNWCLSSLALLEFYAELLTPAKHSVKNCSKRKVVKEALRLHTKSFSSYRRYVLKSQGQCANKPWTVGFSHYPLLIQALIR